MDKEPKYCRKCNKICETKTVRGHIPDHGIEINTGTHIFIKSTYFDEVISVCCNASVSYKTKIFGHESQIT